MQKLTNAKKGFTLIELLTVIAILAILGAIIFPTVGQFRTLAKKTSDSSDLRNIVSASQLFAAQNGERFVDTTQVLGTDGVDVAASNDIVDVAAILAYGGELTDPQTWISANETTPSTGTGGLFTSAVNETDETKTDYATSASYTPEDLSFSYVTGLLTSDPATTPVAFTRMDAASAKTWKKGTPYDVEGGHVAFLGGSVSWYQDLEGKLIAPNGDAADTIETAIPSGALVRAAGP